jgi:Protein of unknown function (DUF1294)
MGRNQTVVNERVGALLVVLDAGTLLVEAIWNVVLWDEFESHGQGPAGRHERGQCGSGFADPCFIRGDIRCDQTHKLRWLWQPHANHDRRVPPPQGTARVAAQAYRRPLRDALIEVGTRIEACGDGRQQSACPGAGVAVRLAVTTGLSVPVAYVLGLGLTTFLAYGDDKLQAIRGGTRLTEPALLGLALLGAALGGWAGMLVRPGIRRRDGRPRRGWGRGHRQ